MQSKIAVWRQRPHASKHTTFDFTIWFCEFIFGFFNRSKKRWPNCLRWKHNCKMNHRRRHRNLRSKRRKERATTVPSKWLCGKVFWTKLSTCFGSTALRPSIRPCSNWRKCWPENMAKTRSWSTIWRIRAAKYCRCDTIWRSHWHDTWPWIRFRTSNVITLPKSIVAIIHRFHVDDTVNSINA